MKRRPAGSRRGPCAPLTAPEIRPKVLFVAHWDWVLLHFRLPLADELRHRGFDVVMVCPPGTFCDELRSSGYRVIDWHVARNGRRAYQELRAAVELTRLYSRERPSVVQHFTIKPNLYGSVAARVARVPAVVNVFSGLGSAFSSERGRRWLRILSPLWRAATKGPRMWTIAQTDEDLALLVEVGLAAFERASIVSGSGVDLAKFRPGTPPDGPPIVLMASRLLHDKGVTEFVVAAQALRNSGLEARFLLVGEPDPGNPTTITDDELLAWKNDGAVEILGHRRDVAELLRGAALAVLPTYYPEGVPRFLLEAAAAGVPAVATTISGCRAVVRDGATGRLVAPRNATILAGAIRELLLDPALRRRMGNAARSLAIEHFSLSSAVREYADVYSNLGVYGSIDQAES